MSHFNHHRFNSESEFNAYETGRKGFKPLDTYTEGERKAYFAGIHDADEDYFDRDRGAVDEGY